MAEKKTITAENQWSETIDISAGYFSVSVQGTFVGTVTVQKTYDQGTNWYDVNTFTAPGEYVGLEGEGSQFRIGAKTGEYSSGTIYVRMGG